MKSESGTYALILFASTGAHIRVGALGPLRVQRGFYIYFGSALGPGGIRGRVTHHLMACGRPHWHIDFLRARAEPVEVWYIYDVVRREHQWATQVKRMPNASVPISGFGCSDCSCDSHLYFFENCPSRSAFQRNLRTYDPAHPEVHTHSISPARRVAWVSMTVRG